MRNWLLGTSLLLVALVPNLRVERLARPEVAPQLGALLAGAPLVLFPLLVLVLLRGAHVDLRRAFFIFLGLDALALLASTAFGLDAQAAFWGRYDRGLGALAYWASMVIGLGVFVGVGRSSRRLRVALLVVAAASVPVSVRAAVEYAETGGRVISSLGNPNYLGNYLILTTVLALGLAASYLARALARRDDGADAGPLWLTGGLLVVVAGLGALGVHWSGTLGALAGLVAGGLLLLGLAPFAFPGARGRSRLLFAALVVVIAIPAGISAWSQVQERLRKEEERPVAAGSVTRLSGRAAIWGAAVPAVPGSMAVGAGPDNFRLAFGPHKTEELARSHAIGMWVDAHNMPLNTLIERGVLGLIAYVGTVFLFFRATFSAFRRSATASRRLWLAGLISAYAGFTVHNLACGDVVPTVLHHYTFLLLGIRSAHVEAEGTPADEGAPLIRRKRRPVALVAAIVVSGVLAVSSLDYVGRVWKADRDVARSIDVMERASWIEDPVQRLRAFQESEKLAARAVERIPFEGKYHWQRSRVLAVLYHLSGKELRYLDEAMRALNAAWDWMKDPGVAAQIARIHVTAGDLPSARRVLEESFLYDPFYFDTRHDLACLLETEGQYGTAAIHAEVLCRIANADTRQVAADVLARIRERMKD